jgi:hypothetical protein
MSELITPLCIDKTKELEEKKEEDMRRHAELIKEKNEDYKKEIQMMYEKV